MNQLTELYNYIKQLAEADDLINSVRKLDFNDIDLDKHTIFPMLNVRITNGTFTNGNTVNFSVQIGVFDIRDTNKEIRTDNFWEQDNEVDNHNLCIAVLNRLWLKMYTDFEDNNITSSENPTFELGFFEKAKTLDGVILSFDVEVPNTTLSLCESQLISIIEAYSNRVIADGGTIEALACVEAIVSGFITNPILAMIPSGEKSTKLYSVFPDDGTGDFTIVTSQKYVTGSTGLLELVPANTPAFDYSDGSGCPALLVEDVSTNLAFYSEDFSNAWWTKQASVTLTTGFLAPDGTNTATKVTGVIGVSYVLSPGGLTSGISNKYIWAKTTVGTGVIHLGSNTSQPLAQFTVTNEWQRFNVSSFNTDIYAVDFRNAGTTLSEIIVWGTQLEQSPTNSSYIYTAGTAVTRAADIETVTTPAGVTSITETIGGVEQTPITVIPATYQIPNGLINKIIME